MDKIAIIGTGYIGTSLGLAIKQVGLKNVEIVGTDLDRGRASNAKKLGAIDQVVGNLRSAAENAEIVIIATPLMAIKDVMEVIGPRLMEGCLVTDTAGTKSIVMEWAEEYLPEGATFVGGNPMVGREVGNSDEPNASIFRNRPYCVIPQKGARQDRVRLLTDMIQQIRAKPYYIALEEHDSFASVVNDLPLLMSVALVGCTSKSPSWDDIAQIASAQYGNLTSLASGDPSTAKGVFAGDNTSIIYWIDAFIKELYDIRQILANDEDSKLENLGRIFDSAFHQRDRWLAGLVTAASQAAVNRERIPTPMEHMAGMFFGDQQARRRLFGQGKRDGDDVEQKR